MRVSAFLLAVVLSLVPAVPARAARPPALTWAPCTQDSTAECTTLQVPLDWSDPYSPKISLAVARRTASDPKERIGTLIVNPGGPGGSGVDFTVDSPYYFTDDIQRHFDIVGFDPRGVSRSSAIRCTATLAAAVPTALIRNQQAYAATIAYNKQLAADCRAATGPVYDHVDMLSNVRDMDALRAALGEDTISYYGASYGSLLGEQYLGMFPQRVRAMALDSVMDHSVGTEDFMTIETAAAQDSFNQFIGWCGRHTECAVHGRNVPQLWTALLHRAAAGTLRSPYEKDTALDPFGLVKVAFSSFYDPQWYSFGYFLRDATAEPDQPGGKAAYAPSGLIQNPFPGIFCSDWDLPVDGFARYEQYLAQLRRIAPQMLGSPLALNGTAGCLGRTSPPANLQAAPPPAPTPVLLLNSRHDPATSYVWAQHVAEQLGPLASLVTYNGWGHVSYNRTPCTSGTVDAYLVSLTRPAAGAACPGKLPDPFGVGGGTGPGGVGLVGAGRRAPAWQEYR